MKVRLGLIKGDIMGSNKILRVKFGQMSSKLLQLLFMIQGQFSELLNLVHLNLANPTISKIEKLMNLGSKLILVRWRIRSYEFDYEQLKSNDFFNIL